MRSPSCCCCGGRRDCLERKRRERRRTDRNRSSGCPRPHHAPSPALVGGTAVDHRAGLLCRVSRLPRLRRRAVGHDPVRAVARSGARLCRHHHARPCGVLRRRRLYGWHAGVLRDLDRADHELAAGGCRRGRHRLFVGPGAVAHPRADAAHAHAVHHGAPARSRQHGARLYRRLRRPAGSRNSSSVRRVRVQPALRQYPISLQPRRAAGLLHIRAHADLLAIRAKPDRHPREPLAHACDRLAGAAPAGHLLHHLGGARRHRRRPVGAEQCLCEPERARSRSRRHRLHRAHPRWLRPALRRFRRRGGLPGARALPRPNLSDRLAARARTAPGHDRAVRPQRHFGHRRGAVAALWRAAQDAMSEPRLETKALSRNFGALRAVQNIDFKLEAGARHALIGPNGAGKTTFINLLTGVLPPSEGRVLLAGCDITGKGQAERVKLGVARTFQINRLFRGLSVLENVSIAVAERKGTAWSMLYPVGRRADVIAESIELLETLKLADIAGHRVSELPYGRQRLVELAITLALKPDVLLLDEPAAGVPSAESHIILDAIEALPNDIAVLIIEHDMDVVFRFAKHVTVMVSGAVFASGTPRDIEANPHVRAVYLGQAGRGSGRG